MAAHRTAIAALPTESWRRVEQLLNHGGVTDSALLAIKALLREHPDTVTGLTRKTLTKTRLRVVEGFLTIETLVLYNGGEFRWYIADVGRTHNWLMARVDDFAAVIKDFYAQRPCTFERPWHLYYYDESAPGDGLRLDQKRKTMSIYIAIRELGNTFLKQTVAWIPIGYLRTTVYQR